MSLFSAPPCLAARRVLSQSRCASCLISAAVPRRLNSNGPRNKHKSSVKDHLSFARLAPLTDLLDTLIPSVKPQTPYRFYPMTTVLAFFPPVEQDAADGGIQRHVPPSMGSLARNWEEWDAGNGWKRLWKGGYIEFRKGHFAPMDRTGSGGHMREGVAAICRERVAFREEEGGGTRVLGVDVQRAYIGLLVANHAVSEQRKLAFVPGHVDPVASSEGRIIKPRHKPTHAHVFCPSADDIAQFSKLTHNDHFIHLVDPRRALVQGNLYLAAMLHVLDDFCREANEAARRDGRGALPRYFVRSLSYSILRPMVAGSKLRVCWKVDEREGERQGGNDKGARDVTWRDQDWPIWIEAADGGMVVKATVTVKCATRRDAKNNEKEV